MSKLGCVVKGGSGPNFVDFCRAKPAMVYVEENGAAVAAARVESGGHALTIYGDPSVTVAVPGQFNQPPEQYAAIVHRELKPRWAQVPADYYLVSHDWGDMDLLAIGYWIAFEREVMRQANADGIRLCVLNLPSGWPGDFEAWQEVFAPFIAEAWLAGNIYGRQVWAADLVDPTGEVLPGDPMRPFDEMAWLGQGGGLALTQVGLNVGLDGAGIQRFLTQMTAYERALRPYPALIGLGLCCLGAETGSDNWQMAVPNLARYMIANPTPAWTPEVVAESVGFVSGTAAEAAAGPGEIGRIVDVSRWQGRIDWKAFKADGVNFAFIRASSGPGDPIKGSAADTTFDLNVAECNRLGIGWGAYHFLYPGAIKQQAALFAAQCGRYMDTMRLPPVLDVELASLSAKEVKAFIDAWNELVPDRMLMIYTNLATWNRLEHPEWSARHPLWIANWTSSTRYLEPSVGQLPRVPKPWSTWAFWQWTSHGEIFGHTSRVDLNAFNGDLNGLQHFIETGELIEPGQLPRLPRPQLDLSPYFMGSGSAKSPVYELTVSQLGRELAVNRHQLQVEPADEAGNVGFFYVKGGDDPVRPAQWEEWQMNPAAGTIQRSRDTSHSLTTFIEVRDSPDRRWSNWCPIKMTLGDSFRQQVGQVSIISKDGCRLIRLDRDQESWIKLVGVFKKWRSPVNDIVINDVIQLRWSQAKDGPMLMDAFYSADPLAPGLVGWDHYDGHSARPSRLFAIGEVPELVRERISCP